MQPVRLILASNNRKKLAELQSLLSPSACTLVAQGELGISEADEPHGTFVENALAKARHAAQLGNGPAIADDSGLCVHALGGAPGVISAHFAPVALPEGEREAQRAWQDAANNRLLLERLHGVADRSARFVGTLVALRRADDPEPLIAVGRWQGCILEAMPTSAAGGFGYDPLMFIPSLNASVAELGPELKNANSHRALAARQMLVLMRESWRV